MDSDFKISDFPDEILLNIYDYLDISSIRRMRQVEKGGYNRLYFDILTKLPIDIQNKVIDILDINSIVSLISSNVYFYNKRKDIARRRFIRVFGEKALQFEKKITDVFGSLLAFLRYMRLTNIDIIRDKVKYVYLFQTRSEVSDFIRIRYREIFTKEDITDKRLDDAVDTVINFILLPPLFQRYNDEFYINFFPFIKNINTNKRQEVEKLFENYKSRDMVSNGNFNRGVSHLFREMIINNKDKMRYFTDIILANDFIKTDVIDRDNAISIIAFPNSESIDLILETF